MESLTLMFTEASNVEGIYAILPSAEILKSLGVKASADEEGHLSVVDDTSLFVAFKHCTPVNPRAAEFKTAAKNGTLVIRQEIGGSTCVWRVNSKHMFNRAKANLIRRKIGAGAEVRPAGEMSDSVIVKAALSEKKAAEDALLKASVVANKRAEEIEKLKAQNGALVEKLNQAREDEGVLKAKVADLEAELETLKKMKKTP